jgi:uncharacterized protein
MTPREPPDTRMPASPCIGICLVDPASGHCRGCLRSIAEITKWYAAGAAEKRAMLAVLAERRRLARSLLPEG